jgi:formylglycine-generating enzyme required for sulfatase activity
MAHIFISYSRDDVNAANTIADFLRAQGLTVFIDYESIKGSDHFPERIAQEIIACDWLLVIVSKSSMASRWVIREVEFADEQEKTILVLRLDDTELPPKIFYLARHDYIAAYELLKSGSFSVATRSKLLRTIGLPHESTPLPQAKPKSTQLTTSTFSLLTAVFALLALGIAIAGVAVLSFYTTNQNTLPTHTPLGPPSVATISATQTSNIAHTVAALSTPTPAITVDFATTIQLSAAATLEADGSLTAIFLTSSSLTFAPSPTPITMPIPLQEAMIRARSEIITNDQWIPYIEEFNGVPMALVPMGCFMMGSESGGRFELPIHQQCFDQPFWIDVYEVTNAQFERFGGLAQSSSISTDPNQPRENIDWFEARDFCQTKRADNVRLPTEREWEYAARGVDNLIYPWGNSFDAESVVYNANFNDQADIVGSRPAGVSWVGSYDMIGNVWEWVSSASMYYEYDPTDGRENLELTDLERVIRGHSFISPADFLRASFREGSTPLLKNRYGGFRCARSA